MGSTEEQILRTTKEVVVKFIETGRVSPTSFSEIFQNVYQTVENAVKKNQKETENKS